MSPLLFQLAHALKSKLTEREAWLDASTVQGLVNDIEALERHVERLEYRIAELQSAECAERKAG